MSLTVKHLNNDASFLLTFNPVERLPPTADSPSNAFTIVLDPWLDGESKIWHSKFSVSTQKELPCVSSLAELPEPDLVIISQDKEDHCHARTLKTLPASLGRTKILAEPASARLIRGWKYFNPDRVQTLPKWEEKRADTVHRIALKPLDEGGLPGEITIAFVVQKLDVTGLHSAICITYRPPTYSELDDTRPEWPLTPPASPSLSHPTTPDSSKSSSSSSSSTPRTLSVIFSPHGIEYSSLAPFVTSHLIRSAALPLTALLHCFDRVSNPWYMGGNICAGMRGGAEIAQTLLAGSWISAHDGDKDTRGFATLQTVVKRYSPREVEEVVSPRSAMFPEQRATDVVVLKVGEEMVCRPQS